MSDAPTSPPPGGGAFPAPSLPSRSPGLGQRILHVFGAPRRAFQPPLGHAVWITALAILFVGQISEVLLLRDLTHARLIQTFEDSQNIPEDQKEKILERVESGQTGPMFLVQNVGGVLVYLAIGFVLPALLMLFGMNFVLGARCSFREVLGVTTLSGLLLLARDLLRTPIKLAKGTLDVFTSPAALVDPTNLPLVFALNQFDIFDLYRLVLLALGLGVVSGLPPRRAAFPVVAVWLLYGVVGTGCLLSPLTRMLR